MPKITDRQKFVAAIGTLYASILYTQRRTSTNHATPYEARATIKAAYERALATMDELITAMGVRESHGLPPTKKDS